MLTFRGKNYYSPLEASQRFKISLSTIYYWIRKNEFEGYILNLTEFGKEKELDTKELRASKYIDEKILKEKAQFLDYTEIDKYTIDPCFIRRREKK